ncbi:hypothetical protein GCM10009743_65750 [Kribbella swartbergensis]
MVTANGTRKAISHVEVGGTVLAEDPETGERGPRKVTHVWEHADAVFDLEIDGDVVTATEDHPFWSSTDRAWQEAPDLDAGDLVRTPRGELVAVGTRALRPTGTVRAFNLTVAGIHTYFVAVGEDEVLVHNTCGPAEVPQRHGGTAVEGGFQFGSRRARARRHRKWLAPWVPRPERSARVRGRPVADSRIRPEDRAAEHRRNARLSGRLLGHQFPGGRTM